MPDSRFPRQSTCKNCPKGFVQKSEKHVFCSNKCRMKWNTNPQAAGKLQKQIATELAEVAPDLIARMLGPFVGELESLRERVRLLEGRGNV
jgi:hypothetical protein